MGWLVDQLVGWLVGQLVGWSVGWLVGQSIHLSVCRQLFGKTLPLLICFRADTLVLFCATLPNLKERSRLLGGTSKVTWCTTLPTHPKPILVSGILSFLCQIWLFFLVTIFVHVGSRAMAPSPHFFSQVIIKSLQYVRCLKSLFWRNSKPNTAS